MIIECINCKKVFEINSELIPENGRTIQCGSCNHVWFYNPRVIDIKKDIKQEVEINISERPTKKKLIKANKKFLRKKIILN